MAKPLDIAGSVSISANDQQMRFWGDGEIVHLNLENSSAGAQLLKLTPAKDSKKQLLAKIHQSLCFADITLQVDLNGRMIGRLGKRARPGLWSRILGLGPMQIRLFPWIRIWFSQ